MFETNGYADYTSALEADVENAKQNIFKRIAEWFQKKIEKIKDWFKKEKNPNKKSIWSKLLTAVQGFFSRFKRAKTTEEAVQIQEETKNVIEEKQAEVFELNETEANNLKIERSANKDDSYKEINGAGKYKVTDSERKNIESQRISNKLDAWKSGDKSYKNLEDDDLEVEEDIEVDDAVESYRRLEKLAANEDLKTAIENVQTNVDTNCTTAEEAAAYLENIETEISKFNRDINTLKSASESMAAYGFDQNRFNTIAAPAVESLKNSFAQVGFTVNTASGIDQEACESMSYFLKTARNIINNKVDEFKGAVENDYAGEASFLATLTI